MSGDGDAEALYQRGCGFLESVRGADTEWEFRTDYEAAAVAFEKVVRLRPDHRDAWFHLGESRAALSQNAEALAAFSEAIRLKPEDDEAWFRKALALGSLGRKAEALEAFDEVLAFRPDDGEAWFRKAAILDSLARPAEALRAYDETIRAESRTPADRRSGFSLRTPEAMFQRAGALERLGRRDDAVAAFREAFRLDREKNGRAGSGHWFSELLERSDLACAAYEESVPLEPEERQPRIRAAMAFLSAQRGAEALRQSEEVVRRTPTDYSGWFYKAEALDRLGRREEAVAAYRESLRLRPDFIAARARLDALLREPGR